MISNFNSVKYLELCLNSILKTKYPNFEIIIVDDASTDRSVTFLRSKFGRHANLKIIKNEKQIGLTRTFNRGFRVARGPYIVFMHSDTRVGEDWLANFVETMESDPRIGAAQGKVLSLDKERTILSVGQFPDFLGYPLLVKGFLELDRGQFNRSFEIFNAWDACMIVRRSVLDEVGPFDPVYNWFREEQDICWRIWLRGYKVVYVPTVEVWHKSTVLFSRYVEYATFHRFKNYLVTQLKNYGIKNLILYFPFAFILTVSRMLIFECVLSKDSRQSFAAMRGILWVFQNLSYVLRERFKVQHEIRRVPDSYVKRLMIKPNPRKYLAQIFRLKSVLRAK